MNIASALCLVLILCGAIAHEDESATLRREDVERGLRRLRAHDYTLPAITRLQGITNFGNGIRLFNFLSKALHGQPLHGLALGGSITFGAGVQAIDQVYPARLQVLLGDLFPPAARHVANHSMHNGAVRGTTSMYMSVCLDLHQPPGQPPPDLVILEYAVNDPPAPYQNLGTSASRAGLERLIRKVLGMPSKPVVILLNCMFIKRDLTFKFWENAERDFHELALYYSLPTISFKAALFHKVKMQEPGFDVTTLFGDHGTLHPSGAAHGLITEFILTLFMVGLQNMVLTDSIPPSPPDPLVPVPMIPNNFESNRTQCFMEHSFKEKVLSSEGWSFTDEGLGAGKLGWVSQTPGAQLVFQVDTRAPAASGYTGPVAVSVAYLLSYEKMGAAMLLQAQALATEDAAGEGFMRLYLMQQVNALYWRKASLTSMADVVVTQHENCQIAVTVVAKQKSKSTKFKVMGATVSSEALAQGPRKGLIKFIREDTQMLLNGQKAADAR